MCVVSDERRKCQNEGKWQSINRQSFELTTREQLGLSENSLGCERTLELFACAVLYSCVLNRACLSYCMCAGRYVL